MWIQEGEPNPPQNYTHTQVDLLAFGIQSNNNIFLSPMLFPFDERREHI